MKWIPKDIEVYLKSKEYVDTAAIPLIPISFGEDMKQTASMAEFMTLLSSLLERQFAGRLLLLPPYTYIKTDDFESLLNKLEFWVQEVKNSHFKHIFFITCDSEWKLHEDKVTESLIWIPALPLENLENSQKISVVDRQIHQLLSLFTGKWTEKQLS